MAIIQLIPVTIMIIEKFLARECSSGDRSAMDAKQILRFPEKNPVNKRLRIKTKYFPVRILHPEMINPMVAQKVQMHLDSGHRLKMQGCLVITSIRLVLLA